MVADTEIVHNTDVLNRSKPNDFIKGLGSQDRQHPVNPSVGALHPTREYALLSLNFRK